MDKNDLWGVVILLVLVVIGTSLIAQNSVIINKISEPGFGFETNVGFSPEELEQCTTNICYVPFNECDSACYGNAGCKSQCFVNFVECMFNQCLGGG